MAVIEDAMRDGEYLVKSSIYDEWAPGNFTDVQKWVEYIKKLINQAQSINNYKKHNVTHPFIKINSDTFNNVFMPIKQKYWTCELKRKYVNI